LPAQQLAQQLLWDVRRFVGLADQSDDITILVVKIA
jgi:serine phosphatase RsbU (regulator of sigma subunit)